MCNSVLVVDDNDSLRTALVAAVSNCGVPVAGARDGSTGLALLNSLKSPCLVFLDLMMPRSTGWDFMSALGEESSSAGHIVIVMSAVNPKIGPASRLGRVPDGYLQKPPNLNAIKQLLDKHINRAAPQAATL